MQDVKKRIIDSIRVQNVDTNVSTIQGIVKKYPFHIRPEDK
jgi:hypothetical protein